MGKYFGTDGFRGEAGITLTANHAFKIGRFLGWYYGELKRQAGDLTCLQGCAFLTAKGLRFTYKIKGGEMFVNRKSKSITQAAVFMAFRKAVELGGVIAGPKKLGTFGASYLYPVFVRIGVIGMSHAGADHERTRSTLLKL